MHAGAGRRGRACRPVPSSAPPGSPGARPRNAGPPLREKTLWRMLYETAARAAEILEIDVQDLDLDNRQAPIPVQRRRDPMGVAP